VQQTSIAYLVNRYPDFSHTFIRRELVELERRGVRIQRYTIRPPNRELPDFADRREADRVHVVLRSGFTALAVDVLLVWCTRPRKFARAAASMFGFLRQAKRRPIAHLAYLVEACHLARRLAEHPVDILHAHFGTNPATVALLVRALGGPPVIITVHGPEEFEESDRLALATKVANAAATIAVCDHGAGILRMISHSRDAGPIHVVHCGVDAEHLDFPSEELPVTPRIACVGRMSEQKDHQGLLEAVGVLSARGVAFELELIGDGPLRPKLERQAQALGLSGRVTFRGWLSGAEVAARLRQSRLVTLASRAEGLPLVIIEAFAARRPVVATAVGGVAELVDETCGWLVPPGDKTSLAAALETAVTAPDEVLAAMGARGRQRIEAGFRVDQQAALLISIHREVLAVERGQSSPEVEP
jgi:glycosyltransferase involved in cell wall biosynthesis